MDSECVQRFWGIRGSIYTGRYHGRGLESPTEVRRLFSDVLGSVRHHGAWKDDSTDLFLTAYWFEGWHHEMKLTPPCEPESIISRARSWFAKTGWRSGERKGPLHDSEVSLPNAGYA